MQLKNTLKCFSFIPYIQVMSVFVNIVIFRACFQAGRYVSLFFCECREVKESVVLNYMYCVPGRIMEVDSSL